MVRFDNEFLKRFAVVVCVLMAIGFAHSLSIGRTLPKEVFPLFRNYVSDLVYPFVCYFLLCLIEHRVPVLRRWEIKWSIVFLLGAMDETLQYLGMPLLGTTFDYRDYLVYAVWGLAAVLVDRSLFPRIFPFWLRGEAATPISKPDGSPPRDSSVAIQ